ncbi:MAG: C4-dicarboxylate ABC transporter substrate-binding protein [Rhodospirillaceae bacterium]|nr:C4-dicarboxylate ABC transporter substrate-binding protein [Rhodospirillaceae bacterium]
MRKTIIALSVIGFGIAGLAEVSVPGSAQAQEVKGPEITWRMSLWGKRRAFTEAPEYVSKAVSDATGGNFNIKLYYGQQLSKSKENLDGISVGAFEMASFCAAYHPGKNKPLNVLDLPFLPLANLDIMRKVHDVIYKHPSSTKALAKWNAKIYMSMMLPQYEYMGKGKPPASVADFKGKRLRALGGMGAAAKKIGAKPTSMPASEVYTALQRGTVDAIGFPYTYTFAAYKLDEISDWYTTNMSLGTVNCPIVFNIDSYEALPAQYKKLLDDVQDGAYEAQKAAYAAKDKVNVAKWAADPKLTAVKIPENQMAEFRKQAGRPVWEEWVKKNEGRIPAQELLDLVLKTAKGG